MPISQGQQCKIYQRIAVFQRLSSLREISIRMRNAKKPRIPILTDIGMTC
ncbi:hypothetical protein TSAR_005780 [Trichomalopsis sarcophagae]|uniref:Uncharacterized protein n=1 Tax=Trichomalopsis sarcophagae TaxID=543379 RepID=A0A232EM77_9HYME|nr:hypothetical protein TSAR_005780 [Trichomalopsis sarcophagae]